MIANGSPPQNPANPVEILCDKPKIKIANKNPDRICIINGDNKASDISEEIIKIFTKKYYS